MSRWKRTMLLGGIHYCLQIFVYVLAFALGPAITTYKVLGISLYDVAAVITFPFVLLSEKFQWSGLGLSAFFLNSVAWTIMFYLMLVIMASLTTTKNSKTR